MYSTSLPLSLFVSRPLVALPSAHACSLLLIRCELQSCLTVFISEYCVHIRRVVNLPVSTVEAPNERAEILTSRLAPQPSLSSCFQRRQHWDLGWLLSANALLAEPPDHLSLPTSVDVRFLLLYTHESPKRLEEDGSYARPPPPAQVCDAGTHPRYS